MTAELCIDGNEISSPLAVNEFPPGYFISDAMKGLPAAGPDVPPQTVEIDARPGWGRYRVSFKVVQNPRRGMRTWFWTLDV